MHTRKMSRVVRCSVFCPRCRVPGRSTKVLRDPSLQRAPWLTSGQVESRLILKLSVSPHARWRAEAPVWTHRGRWRTWRSSSSLPVGGEMPPPLHHRAQASRKRNRKTTKAMTLKPRVRMFHRQKGIYKSCVVHNINHTIIT